MHAHGEPVVLCGVHLKINGWGSCQDRLRLREEPSNIRTAQLSLREKPLQDRYTYLRITELSRMNLLKQRDLSSIARMSVSASRDGNPTPADGDPGVMATVVTRRLAVGSSPARRPFAQPRESPGSGLRRRAWF
jgi:hypothetical protein